MNFRHTYSTHRKGNERKLNIRTQRSARIGEVRGSFARTHLTAEAVTVELLDKDYPDGPIPGPLPQLDAESLLKRAHLKTERALRFKARLQVENYGCYTARIELCCGSVAMHK